MSRSAPTPGRLFHQVEAIKAQLSELAEGYAWAYDAAWAAPTTSAARVGSGAPVSQSDVTGNFATADVGLREATAEAAATIARVHRDLRRIKLLPEPDQTVIRPERFPRTVTKLEREQSMQAARRRRARGEGFGVG